ncbi:hypothetical protein [Marinomonas sp. 2405UD68-3]|uniref:hypothetical protein n=1 Tax=Marinomonas sp. 2405UD68-3 TaxID=3391835 RepID=UPI0039C97FF1
MTLYLVNNHSLIARITVIFLLGFIFNINTRNEFPIKPISYPNITKNHAKIMLGKALFSDRILFDNGKSCTGCHLFSQGGAFSLSPYFHYGSIATLDEVVKTMVFYPLGLVLSDKDSTDLVSSLESLSGNFLPRLMD